MVELCRGDTLGVGYDIIKKNVPGWRRTSVRESGGAGGEDAPMVLRAKARARAAKVVVVERHAATAESGSGGGGGRGVGEDFEAVVV